MLQRHMCVDVDWTDLYMKLNSQSTSGAKKAPHNLRLHLVIRMLDRMTENDSPLLDITTRKLQRLIKVNVYF